MPHAIFLGSFLLLLLAQSNALFAADNGLNLRFAGSKSRHNADNLFNAPSTGSYSLEEAAYSYKKNGVNLQTTFFNENRAGDATGRVDINEFYIDKSLGDWEMTLGKKKLGWGVGYGFRPLDVIVHEPRRLLIPATTVGLPMLAFEHFSSDVAVTFLCGDDFGDDDRLTLANADRSSSVECAARYYGLINDWDTQFIAHSTPGNDFQTGVGVARVFGDSLELHGEFLIQRHYYKYFNTLLDGQNPIATADPVVIKQFKNGLQGTLGMTYTWANGFSLITEYWHDDVAYSHQEWKKAFHLLQQQNALFGSQIAPDWAIQQNILATSRYLTPNNLAKDNLLLHWSFDGEINDPAIDILYLPGDGGVVGTLSVDTKLRDAIHLNYGVRKFQGNKESIVSALPDKLQGYIILNASFSW